MWVDIPGEGSVPLRRGHPVARDLGADVDHVVVRSLSASRQVPVPPGGLRIETDFASVPGLVRHREIIRVTKEGDSWGRLPRVVWGILGIGMVALVVGVVGIATRSAPLMYVGVAVAAVASLVWIVAYVRVHWALSDGETAIGPPDAAD